MRTKSNLALAAAACLVFLGRRPLAGQTPDDFQVFQSGYQDPQAGNSILIAWTESSPNPGGVKLLLDGTTVLTVEGLPAGSLPGTNSATLTSVPGGRHLFSAEGAAGSLGSSPQVVLDEQPFADPTITGCDQLEADGDCEIDVSLTNPGPIPTTYRVLLDGQFQLSAQGFVRKIVVPGVTAGKRCVDLVGVMVVSDPGSEGRYLGTPVQSCCQITCGAPAGNRFLRGGCNGAGAIDISSAIYGLSYLFTGGPAPPCAAACDTNGDRTVDISDMVYLLSFLFTGGPAPSGWPAGQPAGESAPPRAGAAETAGGCAG
jgi:hypothetical protein